MKLRFVVALLAACLAAYAGPVTPSNILFFYRLDPWLISGNYGEGFWVSTPVFGPVTQGGATFALETRAEGLDAQGQVVLISPQWISSDPTVVTVSPSQGRQVTITVRGTGQSIVQVISAGVSKELAITSTPLLGDAIQVVLDQTTAPDGVPESSTAALFGLGVAALSVARARRWLKSSSCATDNQRKEPDMETKE